MTTRTMRCPRCEGRMSDGFLLESGDYNWPSVSRWVEGTPEESRWTGLKLKGRRVLQVRTHRCEKCGYLEFYAPDAPVDGERE